MLITFDLKGTADSRVGPVLAAVRHTARDHPRLFIGEAGQASTIRSINDTSAGGLRAAERLSIPITLLVLLFAFGPLVAALLPVSLALTAIAAATGLLGLASHWLSVAQTAGIVLAPLGLAVGVDYSLFYLKREPTSRPAETTPSSRSPSR